MYRHAQPTEDPENDNIIVSSGYEKEEQPQPRWAKSEHANSQPAIQIEKEEADKAGGMWSCSKWIIF